jgi:hypothetical protein
LGVITLTIHNLRCDVCGCFLSGPAAGVRFVYHPGVPELRDDSGMACAACWDTLTQALDLTVTGRCAACAEPVARGQSLHVRRFSQPGSWRLCARDAVGFLNSLRTVEPKLDPAAFRFPGTPERA